MTKQKSFIEKLKEHKEKSTPRLRGVVAVLACKDDILQGLEAGFTLKDIYALLSNQGRMPVTYSGFIKMVRKHIQPTDHPRQKDKDKSDRQPLAEPKGTEQLYKKNKGPRPDHVFNPDNYDPDELI